MEGFELACKDFGSTSRSAFWLLDRLKDVPDPEAFTRAKTCGSLVCEAQRQSIA